MTMTYLFMKVAVTSLHFQLYIGAQAVGCLRPDSPFGFKNHFLVFMQEGIRKLKHLKVHSMKVMYML